MAERDIDKLKHSLKVAELYFQQGLGQQEIAKEMGISRPTVSRLLQYAKDNGLVKIQIINPLVDSQVLGSQLSTKYGIDVHVVSTEYGSSSDNRENVGKFAADYLASIVKPGDIIGIGWGKTIHSMAKQLEPQAVPGVQAVQLKGSVSYSTQRTFAYESINELANAYRITPEYLPLPVIFDNQITKDMVEKDRHIRHVLDLGQQANIAVFTVGTVRSEALIFQLGYFNDAEISQLQNDAVGDIVSRFIDKNGHIVNQGINDRTIGISPTDLKNKEHAILVATGNQKVAGVHAALTAKYANCAILDQNLAQQLINY